ncbi:MAG TPA: hypothetical protein VFK06_22725, partial [Candidatus Angelobacter sp.]|nr:hypothetical protein [Candidatus Angelobacter sp.]
MRLAWCGTLLLCALLTRETAAELLVLIVAHALLSQSSKRGGMARGCSWVWPGHHCNSGWVLLRTLVTKRMGLSSEYCGLIIKGLPMNKTRVEAVAPQFRSILFILLITFLVYLQAVRYPFLSLDDTAFIVDRQYVHQWSSLPSFFTGAI